MEKNCHFCVNGHNVAQSLWLLVSFSVKCDRGPTAGLQEGSLRSSPSVESEL